ncbi:MAG: penicillin-binding protein 2, partial [bacterium]
MWYKDRGWTRVFRQIKLVKFIFAVSFFLVACRIFQVQILSGFKFSEKSRENYLKRFIIPPDRGKIISADGEVLATTYISYDLVSQVVPGFGVMKKLSKITGIPESVMRKDIDRALRKKEILITLAKDIKGRALISIASVINEFPNMRIIKAPKRFYPFEEVFSHITGYLGPALKDEKAEMPYSYVGALHGKSGIEKTFDRFLFGKPGGEILVVDSLGRIVQVKGSVQPASGDEVILTVDSRLQRAAFEAFDGRHGAAVGLNPKTGAVLLLVSSPGFKPSVFVDPAKDVAEIMKSPDIPLVNRAIQMKYPPGSAFKIVTSAAALNEGIIDPADRFLCEGIFKFGRQEFKCWKEEGHGEVAFMDGFSKSCNVYFYNVALKTGGKNLSKYAHLLGLDLLVFDDITGELTATIPGPAWKKKKYKRKWLPGDSINMGIGQGFLWITPLQAALMTEGISQKGVIFKPFLVEKILDGSNNVKYKSHPEIVKKYRLKDETFELLRSALRETVISGTGQILNIKNCEISGKTGTAQNPKGEDHGWFVSAGGGEYDDFCLVVVVEHGG